MRVEPELMRDILTAIEAIPADEPLDGTLTFEDRRQPDVNEHIRLLFEDGYLRGRIDEDEQGFPASFSIRGLTMKGHQFVGNARNDTVWKKVLAKAKETGQSLTMTILNGLLEKAAKNYFGID